jgi:hypothetical protein
MTKRFKIDNAAAWEHLKKEGLVVDAQVHDDGEVWMGFVHKDRTFWHGSGIFKKKYHNAEVAQRDSRAVARAVSRETGIPLHHTIPAERFKQVPSWTKDRALLQWEFDARQREAEEAFIESPKGVFLTVVVFVVLSAVGIGGCLFLAWLGTALGT